MVAPTSRMRVAVIGASHWHLDLFLPTLLEMPDVELAGVADPDAAVAEKLGRQLGCAWSAHYEQLCDEVRPDFVLALGEHADMPAEAAYLIERGILFAMEKPCGTSSAQVHDLAGRAAAAGAFAAIPFVWRQSELLALMREHFADDELDYLSFRWIAGPPTRYVESGCGWMLDPARSGGGCTINLSVHMIDLARVLFGDDLQVAGAVMANTAYGLPVEDYSLVTLRSGGRLLTVETGYLMPAAHSTFDMRFSVKAGDRYLMATGPQDVEIVAPDGQREHVRAHTTNVPHYPVFVRDVLRRVRAGEPPLASLTDMAAAMDLVQEAYRIGGIRHG
jgi:predicted dehydrogenase